MITAKAKIQMTAADTAELKLLAGAFQDAANLITDDDNEVTAKDMIYLLQQAKADPKMILNALSFLE